MDDLMRDDEELEEGDIEDEDEEENEDDADPIIPTNGKKKGKAPLIIDDDLLAGDDMDSGEESLDELADLEDLEDEDMGFDDYDEL